MRCKLPPRYRVVGWYRWQENKTLFLLQVLAIFSISLTLMQPVIWSAILNSTIIASLVFMSALFILLWVRWFTTYTELYAMKDHVKVVINGKTVIDIPLSENDVITIAYNRSPAFMMFRNSGILSFVHKEITLGKLPINSRRLVTFLSNSLSQFINCHPDFVNHPVKNNCKN